MRATGLFGVRGVAAVLWSVAAAVLFLGMSGCGGPSYTVRVGLDNSWASTGRVPTLEVDLVGANLSESGLLSQKDLRDYFSAGDPIRSGYPKRTFSFTEGNVSDKVLESNDAIWKAWNDKNVSELFVLVNLPGVGVTQPGALDPRRLIVPLDKALWATNEIEIEVRRSGLVVLTERREAVAGR